ncbi:MAG: hypothetical protein M1816_004748 [Peltula sp. TS41687]|nr:MAG: hypothetical protein M1816_004748 [Peltula sp. TS41687]
MSDIAYNFAGVGYSHGIEPHKVAQLLRVRRISNYRFNREAQVSRPPVKPSDRECETSSEAERTVLQKMYSSSPSSEIILYPLLRSGVRLGAKLSKIGSALISPCLLSVGIKFVSKHTASSIDIPLQLSVANEIQSLAATYITTAQLWILDRMLESLKKLDGDSDLDYYPSVKNTLLHKMLAIKKTFAPEDADQIQTDVLPEAIALKNDAATAFGKPGRS